jgi:Fur family ferric uptake transcriptional regulator
MERFSRQRDAIFAAFTAAGRPLSPQEVLENGRAEAPTLSIATVYRAIKALVEEESLRPVKLPGEPDRYELSALAEHHHFKCGRCGRVFDVDLDLGARNLSPPGGFRVERAEVMLYGRCNDCPPASGRRA